MLFWVAARPLLTSQSHKIESQRPKKVDGMNLLTKEMDHGHPSDSADSNENIKFSGSQYVIANIFKRSLADSYRLYLYA